MEGKHRAEFQTVLQVLQILVISIGLAGLFVRIGEYQATLSYNSEQLDELQNIVEDLVKSQIEFASTDAALKERIDALRTRMDRIDRSN